MIDLLNNIEGFEFLKETDNAYVFKYPISNYDSYNKHDYIAIPKYIDSNTPVYVILDPGPNNRASLDAYYQNTNAIVINPFGCSLSSEVSIENFDKLIGQINDTLGTNLQVNGGLGFSRTTTDALSLALYNIKKGIETGNPAPRQVIILADPCASGDNYNYQNGTNVTHYLNKENEIVNGEEISRKALLKENDAIIVGIEEINERNNNTTLDTYKTFGENGNKTFIFFSADGHANSYHTAIEEGLLDVLSGDVEASKRLLEKYNTEQYTDIIVYDPELEDFRAATADDFLQIAQNNIYSNFLYKLNSLSETTNIPAVNTYIAGIKNAINNLMSLKSDVSIDFNSTTNIPTKEPIELNNINSKIFELLEKLLNNSISIINMATNYKNLDDNFASDIEDILGAITPIIPTSPVPSELAPSKPTPSESTPSKPTPSEPTPSEPTPSEPTPNEPTPNEPTPSEPSPSEPSTPEEDADSEQSIDNEYNDEIYEKANEEYESLFPEIDELISNDNRLVYSIEDNSRLVIYLEDKKVTYLEHYYSFNSNEEAKTALQQIKSAYNDNNFVKTIILNNNKIKVVFDKDVFKDMSYDMAVESYSHLKQIK